MNQSKLGEWSDNPVRAITWLSALAILAYGLGWAVVMASDMGFSPYSDIPRAFVLAAGVQLLAWTALAQAALHLTAALFIGARPIFSADGRNIRWDAFNGSDNRLGAEEATVTSLSVLCEHLSSAWALIGAGTGTGLCMLLASTGWVIPNPLAGTFGGAIVGATVGRAVKPLTGAVVGTLAGTLLALVAAPVVADRVAATGYAASVAFSAWLGAKLLTPTALLAAVPTAVALAACVGASLGAGFGAAIGVLLRMHETRALTVARRVAPVATALTVPPLLSLWIVPYLLMIALSPTEVSSCPSWLVVSWWAYVVVQAIVAVVAWGSYWCFKTGQVSSLLGPVLLVLALGLLIPAFATLIFPVLRPEWGGGAPTYAQLRFADPSSAEGAYDVVQSSRTRAVDEDRLPCALLGWSAETYLIGRVPGRPSAFVPPRVRINLKASAVRSTYPSTIRFAPLLAYSQTGPHDAVQGTRELVLVLQLDSDLRNLLQHGGVSDKAVMWLIDEDRILVLPWPHVAVAGMAGYRSGQVPGGAVTLSVGVPYKFDPDRLVLAPTNSDMCVVEIVHDER